MSKIYLNNMEFYGFHGCFSEEKIVGTNFRIDLVFETDTEKAQQTDQIDDTVSYLDVYQIVKKEMQIPSSLLENLAERILNAIFQQFSAISNIQIKVSKMNPPLGGKLESVSVEIEKRKLM